MRQVFAKSLATGKGAVSGGSLGKSTPSIPSNEAIEGSESQGSKRNKDEFDENSGPDEVEIPTAKKRFRLRKVDVGTAITKVMETI